MSPDSGVDELLDRWEEARQQGRELSPQDLCRDSPKLLEELTRRIRALRAFDSHYVRDDELASRSGERDGASMPTERIIQQLVESGLIARGEIEAIVAALPSEQRENGREFAQELVRRRRITPYQAESLCQTPMQPIVLGNYVILDKIGQGGMGEVLKAEHRVMRRTVALKILPTSSAKDPLAVQRFHREVQAAAKLSHPNIVTAHDADQASGIDFLVMEYVAGTDLASYVRQNGPLTVDEAVHHVLQTAQGLRYAHENGVVHRDIKPSNLLLDKHGNVKILDMGLARIEAFGADTQAELTHTGLVMGTVDYMAPEQAVDAKHVDYRVDIYALGCTLAYLLTGRPVYSGESLMARVIAHREDPIPSLLNLRSDVPAMVDAVFQKMLAKRPADRQQSMEEVISDLEQAVGWQDRPREAKRLWASSAAAVDDRLSSILRAESTTGTAVKTAKVAGATEETAVGAANQETLQAIPTIGPGQAVRQRSRRKLLIGISGGFPLLGLVAAIVITLQTPQERLILEVNEPDASVEVLDGKGQVQLTRRSGREQMTIAIDPGRHRLKVTKDGFAAFVKEFTIEEGGKAVISARLEKLKPKPSPTKTTQQPKTSLPHADRWESGPADDVLPGMIPRPARLPGIARWQIDTVGPETDVQSLAWSPNGDLLACGTLGGRVRIYHAATFQLKQVLHGHTRPVSSLAWSGDGQHLLSGSYDQTIRIWNVDGTSEHVLHGPAALVWAVDWSPDGKQIVCGQGSAVRLWNADGTSGPVLGRHEGTVQSVAWCPDGNWIASGSADGLVRLWNASGTPGPSLAGSKGPVNAVAWSPDGRWLASGGDDGKVRLWKPDGSAGPVFESDLKITCVAWSPDGRWLASIANSGTTRFWELDGSKGPVLKPPMSSMYGARSLAWDPNGRHVATAGRKTIRLWGVDGTDGPVLTGDTECLCAMAWHPDGRQFGTMTYPDSQLRLWSVDGEIEQTMASPFGFILSIAWHPRGRTFATPIGWDGTLRVWNADGTAEQLLKGHTNICWSVAWSPDGNWLASAAEDGTVRLWREDGTAGPTMLTGGPVAVVAWSPDNQLLASGGSDRVVRIWSRDGTLAQELKGHTGGIRALAWSPDGQRIASGANDAYLRLWNRDGTVGPILSEPTGMVASVTWSPDGDRLAFGSSDGSVSLANSDGTKGPVLQFQAGDTRSLAWSPNGRQLASGNQDGTIRLWDMESSEPRWVASVFTSGKHARFSAAGELLDGDAETIEDALIYLVEQADGRLEILKPSEFMRRIGATEPR